ncbi:GNAT family N-acetyltransferase [Snodgrassella communis]|uniref:GNAT family N-acetyltransferase n=1 Tax=Snodgrassella communis TaxID=2946699 RepID=UPI001EF5F180|nr:GNAT family N-acetyltransferase [Snodgrassella communis]
MQIVDYNDRYQSAFRDLNVAWIAKYFEMEDSDYQLLDNPRQAIIEKGGYILVALDNGKPVGVCALVKLDGDPYDFELAKLAVEPESQGKHIGSQLIEAVITKAREQGAKKLYIESHTSLEPAIHLYQKAGFKEIAGHSPTFSRVNIQMELIL